MKTGKTEKYILEKIEEQGGILLSLIDPDKQPFEKGAKVAEASCEAGADVILVGGSIGAQGMILDKTTKMIRERVNIPIVLFPGNVGTITHFADATYFMYVMNSRETYWMSTVQIQAAPVVKRLGIEPIPTGYIIVEPGKAVGWIANANLIPQNRGDLGAATALAAEYMGAHFVVTDCGSGAEQPAPAAFVKAVKSVLSIPYFYAGGCRTAEKAHELIKAGADGIQIGTAFEIEDGYDKVKQKVSEMSHAIKQAGREKKGKVAQAVEKAKGFMPMIRAPSWFKWKWPSLKKKNGKKLEEKKEEPAQVLKKEKYSLGEKEEKRYYKKR